jgi:DNA-directed RNA polymerase subunit RPC12/RpoP
MRGFFRKFCYAKTMNPPTPSIVASMSPVASASVGCLLFGHRVHYTSIAIDGYTPCARCHAPILEQGNSVSRVAHTLSCFLGKHNYISIATRAAHHEYVCEKCGHSLLFELARDPYAIPRKFKKRVSYACGLFGHRVHFVATGSKATEYACQCGHPFIKAQRSLTVIRHPLACVLLGHFVAVNEIRGDWAEYVCRRCGHPFYFRLERFRPARTV